MKGATRVGWVRLQRVLAGTRAELCSCQRICQEKSKFVLKIGHRSDGLRLPPQKYQPMNQENNCHWRDGKRYVANNQVTWRRLRRCASEARHFDRCLVALGHSVQSFCTIAGVATNVWQDHRRLLSPLNSASILQIASRYNMTFVTPPRRWQNASVSLFHLWRDDPSMCRKKQIEQKVSMHANGNGKHDLRHGCIGNGHTPRGCGTSRACSAFVRRSQWYY